MCEMLQIVSIILMTLNFFTIIYLVAHHTPKWSHFWVSSAIFIAITTLIYFHIISDCSMTYLKLAAAFLGVDFFILIINCGIFLKIEA
jgi:hypothetical protein